MSGVKNWDNSARSDNDNLTFLNFPLEVGSTMRKFKLQCVRTVLEVKGVQFSSAALKHFAACSSVIAREISKVYYATSTCARFFDEAA